MKKYQTDKLELLARLNALEAELLELERSNDHEHDHSGSVCTDGSQRGWRAPSRAAEGGKLMGDYLNIA
jgi:hypothetical protein